MMWCDEVPFTPRVKVPPLDGKSIGKRSSEVWKERCKKCLLWKSFPEGQSISILPLHRIFVEAISHRSLHCLWVPPRLLNATAHTTVPIQSTCHLVITSQLSQSSPHILHTSLATSYDKIPWLHDCSHCFHYMAKSVKAMANSENVLNRDKHGRV
jgi:hypothetical protein